MFSSATEQGSIHGEEEGSRGLERGYEGFSELSLTGEEVEGFQFDQGSDLGRGEGGEVIGRGGGVVERGEGRREIDLSEV